MFVEISFTSITWWSLDFGFCCSDASRHSMTSFMIEKCCGNPLSAVSLGFLSQVQTQMNCLYLLVVDVCQHTGISFPPGSLNQAGMSCSYERKKSCFYQSSDMFGQTTFLSCRLVSKGGQQKPLAKVTYFLVREMPWLSRASWWGLKRNNARNIEGLLVIYGDQWVLW